jgi:imidazolonepropionase-like amidohydrolase
MLHSDVRFRVRIVRSVAHSMEPTSVARDGQSSPRLSNVFFPEMVAAHMGKRLFALIPRLAERHGGPAGERTDAGFAVTPYGEWNACELELFVVDLGFIPAAALRAATEVNAGFMTGGARIGVLDPGRPVDFIALDF